jgi:predicted ArsR family transcriptional regulator
LRAAQKLSTVATSKVMLQNAREIAPSVAWDILLRIKRSGGLSVNELCAQLKMSYMGVKQHCDALKKRGYLDTWRRPKPTGRPEKIYRASDKLDTVLPQWGNELSLGLLNVVVQLNGETAAERLLHHYFLQKTERLLPKIKGTTLKLRAQEVAKLRSADGCLCTCESDSPAHVRLVEHHNPLSEIARLYPGVCEMETRMIAKFLDARVERVAGEWSVEFRASDEADTEPFSLIAE